MSGLEAINNANGWNMAALGILVVFSSLIILSVIISQLHKVLTLWHKKDNWMPGKNRPKTTESAETLKKETAKHDTAGSITYSGTKPPAPSGRPEHPPASPDNIDQIIQTWATLFDKLDAPFDLAQLYKLAAEADMPHPHLTITRLREANLLIPDENRKYTFTPPQE